MTIKTKTVHIYYKAAGKKHDVIYTDVQSIRAGTARQLFDADDLAGNGIPANAPIIRLYMNDGATATYDADNVTILID